MIEEVLPDLFRIQIPLPNNPLKYLNSYVIRGTERNLIIDTGLNREECLTTMQAGLGRLGVALGETDFFITHLHADHFGLVSRLVTDTSTIYFNRPDSEIIEGRGGWEVLIDYAGRSGFPEDELRAALQNHPGYRYGSGWVPELSILGEEDEIRIGKYLFRCVETPGHTRGHICLYEPTRRVLVSGDHILNDITPNIQCWSDEEDPLKDYLASLDKVLGLEVDLVLPGHRRLFRNFEGRVRELEEHHRRRADEVLAILGRGATHAFQVASEMTWDIKYASWDLFPVSQKWFATGEAIAHLRYLEEMGKVRRELSGKTITFSLNHDA